MQKDDKILIQSPVYHYFNIVIQNNDYKVITNNLIYKRCKIWDRFCWFWRETKNDRPKLFILSNPHNPVGKVFQKMSCKNGRVVFKIWCFSNKWWIHRDLVFKDYIFTPFASICEEFLQNSITCTSATKHLT